MEKSTVFSGGYGWIGGNTAWLDMAGLGSIGLNDPRTFLNFELLIQFLRIVQGFLYSRILLFIYCRLGYGSSCNIDYVGPISFNHTKPISTLYRKL